METQLIEEIATFLRNRFFGKYRGTVVQNLDPTGRGRLSVKVPAVLGDEAVMAMPCVPYAGNGVGFHVLPEPGTGVWVEFEAGDPSYPVWTGFFWADGELPEAALSPVKMLKTEQHTMRFDDLTGEITIENSMGASATFNTQIVLDAIGKVTIGPGGIKAQSAVAKTEINASGVSCDSGGLGKLDVTPAGVTVNSGTMEVT